MTARDFAAHLVLGTAQLGLPYGLNNTSGQAIADEETNAILRQAQASGLLMLDTAAAYGRAEAVIGAWRRANTEAPDFQLVTKLRGSDTRAGVAGQLRESRERLGLTADQPLYGLLFHDFETARRQSAEIWDWLLTEQAAGRIGRLGFSLYHPSQLDWLLENAPAGALNLLQLPYNVLDQRFGHYLLPLLRAGTEVHLRSCFLQGLLLRDPDHLPAHFAGLRPKLHRLRTLAAEHELPLSAALLLFAAQAVQESSAPEAVRAHRLRVVVGVDSVVNLLDNLAAGQYAEPARELGMRLLALAEANTNYILPYTWPKNA